MREYAQGGYQLVLGDAFAAERESRRTAKQFPKTAWLFGSGAGPAEPNFGVFDNWIHVPGKTADAAIPFFYDFAETATKLGLIEDGGFQKIVVDDSAGLLTNMDLAAQVLDRTASLEVVLTHWAGVVEPTVAARQLASMDRKSGGRLALRMISEPLNDDDAESRPAGHGRAGKLRFALPVRIHQGASATGHKAVDLSGPPAQVALSLLAYAGLGIDEFMDQSAQALSKCCEIQGSAGQCERGLRGGRIRQGGVGARGAFFGRSRPRPRRARRAAGRNGAGTAAGARFPRQPHGAVRVQFAGLEQRPDPCCPIFVRTAVNGSSTGTAPRPDPGRSGISCAVS